MGQDASRVKELEIEKIKQETKLENEKRMREEAQRKEEAEKRMREEAQRKEEAEKKEEERRREESRLKEEARRQEEEKRKEESSLREEANRQEKEKRQEEKCKKEARLKLQTEIKELRKELLSSVQGQKILLIGGDGHGKSSLINTFNHVVRLQNPQAKFQEIAEMGAGYGDTKTFTFRYYHKGPPGSLFDDVVIPDGKELPHFQDLCGMSEASQDHAVKLIFLLATGKVDDHEDLRTHMDPKSDLDKIDRQARNDRRCWSVLFVASAMHEFPTRLADAVREASEQFQADKSGVKVFCVLTNVDRATSDSVDEAFETAAQSLNIFKLRIFKISNYTPADVRRNLTTVPNLEREAAVLHALYTMVQNSYLPAFQTN